MRPAEVTSTAKILSRSREMSGDFNALILLQLVSYFFLFLCEETASKEQVFKMIITPDKQHGSVRLAQTSIEGVDSLRR